MSFFQDIFGGAKKIVSEGTEAFKRASSTRVNYTAPSPVRRSSVSKYSSDPMLENFVQNAKPKPAQWGMPKAQPVMPKLNVGQTTPQDTVRNPINVASDIIKTGKAGVLATPGVAKEIAQGSGRAYAGVGSTIGEVRKALMNPIARKLGIPEQTNEPLSPRGKFQEALYGTNEPLTARRAGEEIVPKGSKFAPAVGFAVGALDLVGGGGEASKLFKTLAETKDINLIDKTLKKSVPAFSRMPKDQYSSLLETLKNTNKPEDVQNLLTQVSSTLGPTEAKTIKATSLPDVPNTSRGVTGKADFKNIHPADLGEVLDYTEAVNKNKPFDFNNETAVKRIAERYGIDPNQSEQALVKEFTKRIDETPNVREQAVNRVARGGNEVLGVGAGVQEDENGNLTIDPFKSALGVAGAGALQKVGGIKAIDRLIAENKVRVVSRDGRDVYQVKKGDVWKSVRDEDSAVKQATAVKVSKAIELPQRLQERQIANDIAREQLAMDPASQLSKYVAKRGEFKGVIGEATGKKKVSVEPLDVKAMDLGYKNSEEARSAYEAYKARQADILAERSQIRAEAKIARDEVRKATSEEAKLKKISRVSPAEVQSLERTANQLVEAKNLPPAKKPLSLEEIVTRTPLNAKVNFLDYIRTPDRVLQKIGLGKEAKLLRSQYEEYVKELPKNIDTITEWTKRVPKESNVRLFQYLDGQEVQLSAQEQKVADEIKAYLANWADRLGLPEDNRVSNYITHLFEDQLIKKEFDEDLAKLIANKVPGQVYDPFLQKRLGALGYKQDVWAALDAYTKRATRKVHMDVALEKIRDRAGASLEFSNLEKSQFDYIQRYIDRVNMRPTEIDTMIDTTFKQVFGYRLGQRPVLRLMQMMRQLTYRSFLGLNLGSALRNLSQGVNTYSVLGEKYTALGYAKLFSREAKEELVREGVLSNTFVQDRAISAAKKTAEKLDKTLFIFFDQAEKINRGAAYHGAKAKALAEGMKEEKAVEYAKNIVRKTQFNYDAVDTPLVLSPDILKTLFQLQTYTVKQTEFLTELAKDRNFAGLLRYALAGTAFVYTIGQAFGMDWEELLPINSSTGTRFELAPSAKFVKEVGKAVLDSPDQYGNKRDLEQKMKDIGEAGTRMIPAFSQAKKTYEGIKSTMEGGSYDASGRLQYTVGQSPLQKAQAILFGKSSSGGAQEYYDSKNTKSTTDPAVMKPVYDNVQALRADGKDTEAQDIVDTLTKDEYDTYKAYKTQVTKEANAEVRKKVVPIYTQIQQLKKEGKTEEGQALVDGLTDEEYKIYQQVKNDAKKMADAPVERGYLDTVGAYVKAFTIDPGNASKALFTQEKLGRVKGNLVELKRFYGRDYTATDGSEAYIYEQLKLMGIKPEDRRNYNLEHIVPVSAGGDSSPENLRVVDRDTHDSWTPFDIALGDAVKEERLTRKEAEKIARDYKNGVISLEEAKSMIK